LRSHRTWSKSKPRTRTGRRRPQPSGTWNT